MKHTAPNNKKRSSTSELEMATKRSKLDYEMEVASLVGNKRKRFIVHEKVLCSSSRFLQAICRGGCKESTEEVIKLPDVNEDTFAMYVHWLYTGDLDVYDSEAYGNLPCVLLRECKTVGAKAFDTIMEAYMLGDFFDDERFCNVLVNKFLLISHDAPVLPGADLIEKYWSELPEGYGLRRLLVAVEAKYGKDEEFDKKTKLWPHDFPVAVASACMRARDVGKEVKRPEEQCICYYHDHKDEAARCDLPQIPYCTDGRGFLKRWQSDREVLLKWERDVLGIGQSDH